MPDVSGRGRGDLFATVQVQTPKKADQGAAPPARTAREGAAEGEVRAAAARRGAGRAQSVRSRQGHVRLDPIGHRYPGIDVMALTVDGQRSTSRRRVRPRARRRRRLLPHRRRGTRRLPHRSSSRIRRLRDRARDAVARAFPAARRLAPATSTMRTGRGDRRRTSARSPSGASRSRRRGLGSQPTGTRASPIRPAICG